MGTSWGQESDGKPRPAWKTTHIEVPTMATKTSKWFQKATKLVTLGLNHETALKIWHLVSATAVPLLAGVVRCVVSQLKVVKKKKVFMSDVSYIFKAGQYLKKKQKNPRVSAAFEYQPASPDCGAIGGSRFFSFLIQLKTNIKNFIEI